jgi:hypothetical protein
MKPVKSVIRLPTLPSIDKMVTLLRDGHYAMELDSHISTERFRGYLKQLETRFLLERKMPDDSSEIWFLYQKHRLAFEEKGYMRWKSIPLRQREILYTFDTSQLPKKQTGSNYLFSVAQSYLLDHEQSLSMDRSIIFAVTAHLKEQLSLVDILEHLGFAGFVPHKRPEILNVIHWKAFHHPHSLSTGGILPLEAVQKFQEEEQNCPGRRPYPFGAFIKHVNT